VVEDLLGTPVIGFVIITVVMIGFAAYMTGQALANAWRRYGTLVGYCLLLGGASRFLNYALADGRLFSVSGYLCDVAALVLIGTFAFRLTRARRLVAQYPWIYERVGLFGWRERHPR
jgi:hypothetical protein